LAVEFDPARVERRTESGHTILELSGDWVVHTIGEVDSKLRQIERSCDPELLVLDLTHLGRIDTSGAYVLARVLHACGSPDDDRHFVGDHDSARRLIVDVRRRILSCEVEEKATGTPGAVLARIGEAAEAAWLELFHSMAFFGHTLIAAVRVLFNPKRMRWTATIAIMESAGVNALPIIAVLSFFIGAVVAFMGANLLQSFGATIVTVELVGFAVLREFGAIIAAILLAGRSDSAFTAAIGTMKMQQEIDAMKVIGLDPFETLVLPRVIACVIMTPLLTFAAMLTGIVGGALVSAITLDVSPTMFATRLRETLDWTHFMVGMSKAPVFGLVIAIIGCRQGLEVGGDVESLGRRVTASVVQSIFAVIVIDAVFAMVYLELGI
jgi:phospholipid/cholesterol/gamma-HCH transport system permease protein